MQIKQVMLVQFDNETKESTLQVVLSDGSPCVLKFDREAAHIAGLALLSNPIQTSSEKATSRHPIVATAAGAVTYENGQEGLVFRVLDQAALALTLPPQAMDSLADDLTNRRQAKSRQH